MVAVDLFFITTASFVSLLTLGLERIELMPFRFNSVVFSSLTTYAYKSFTVDKEFRLLEKTGGNHFATAYTKRLLESRNLSNAQLDNLTALECINEYGVTFQTKRSDVILVVDTSSPMSESKRARGIHSNLLHNVRRVACPWTDYDWVCPDSVCDSPCRQQLPQVKRQPDNWRPFGNRVEYCLSKPAQERCRLNFDVHLAAIILVVNFIKATILAFIAVRPPKEPLFVLGDAIESFLSVPDENSRGSCLASAHTVRTRRFTQPCIIHTKRKRRGVAVTGRRWFFSLVM